MRKTPGRLETILMTASDCSYLPARSINTIDHSDAFDSRMSGQSCCPVCPCSDASRNCPVVSCRMSQLTNPSHRLQTPSKSTTDRAEVGMALPSTLSDVVGSEGGPSAVSVLIGTNLHQAPVAFR